MPMDNRATMYDGLTGLYRFSCPGRGDVRVPLSSFRTIERLPGTAHPAVYAVAYACACGDEHGGLVSHGELDLAPLDTSDVRFFNLMTSKLEPAAAELLDLAVRHIQAGTWPWSFFCYPESRPRPAFPSSFRLLVPRPEGVGVALRCSACSRTSVNVVSIMHVDLPFYHDTKVTVVEHVFASDTDSTLVSLTEELHSGAFDARDRPLGP